MAARAPTLMQCLLAFSLLSLTAHAQLSTTFYASSCPNLQSIVRAAMTQAVSNERRIGASLLRLFFHDCFVQGCDGSILLDAGGEKTAGPNANSVRGFEVIDTIKRNVETACPGVVSCADILALAARDGTNLLGGPSWNVPLGRRDSTTASASLANQNLPPSTASLGTLVSLFGRQGLSPRDMTALSGAHTIGQARCTTFRARIYGGDANIDASFAALRQQTCPRSGGDGNLAPIDAQTPAAFDTAYFTNLLSRRGLFHSDQELFNGGSQDALVRQYSASPSLFNSDFAAAMIKMGNIGAGNAGQIRRNCRVVNS
ncbi:peroxidase P7-like [Panicum miliaceum]|uniref:Peroxidase n=1 Tax=Panicum miliaceum TaxID=4540 RepID=A0A3L6PFY2_PANMI|nr:peroxidase P7-like [Panicum miliaceum]